MLEIWIVILSLASWCIFHLVNQHLIIIYSPVNLLKIVLAIAVSITLLISFWSSNSFNNLRLIIIAALLIIISALKEGIGYNKVVKLGLLSENLCAIQSIQIEERENFCCVYFFRNTKNSYSLNLKCSKIQLLEFLSNSSFNGNIIDDFTVE